MILPFCDIPCFRNRTSVYLFRRYITVKLKWSDLPSKTTTHLTPAPPNDPLPNCKTHFTITIAVAPLFIFPLRSKSGFGAIHLACANFFAVYGGYRTCNCTLISPWSWANNAKELAWLGIPQGATPSTTSALRQDACGQRRQRRISLTQELSVSIREGSSTKRR